MRPDRLQQHSTARQAGGRPMVTAFIGFRQRRRAPRQRDPGLFRRREDVDIGRQRAGSIERADAHETHQWPGTCKAASHRNAAGGAVCSRLAVTALRRRGHQGSDMPFTSTHQRFAIEQDTFRRLISLGRIAVKMASAAAPGPRHSSPRRSTNGDDQTRQTFSKALKRCRFGQRQFDERTPCGGVGFDPRGLAATRRCGQRFDELQTCVQQRRPWVRHGGRC